MSTFLWLKAFHLIFMVTWFAGLFYLPRLFVYHAELGPISPQDENAQQNHLRFCTMERRLFWGIMTPSAVLTILFGTTLILAAPQGAYQHAGWLHAKLTLVILLLGYHHVCAKYLKRFKNNQNTKSPRFFRWFNEFPAFILVAVIILAVVKPF